MEDDFFAVAHRSGLLPEDAVEKLRASVSGRGVSPAQAALEQGLLSAVQVDIVETLRRPRDVIPGYEILALLGQGGMGVVYRAKQLAFDRIVAMKMVLVGSAASPVGLARFEQEAKTIGRLLHPHIVTAYDFGRHGGRLFLAMELVEGEDAEQYAARNVSLSPRQTWGLIRQAATGLAYAAEAGVIHRDIKPANLLLVPPPKGYPLPPGLPLVKIADFGLALLQDDGGDRTRLTMDNTTLGSPQYMAPEQLSGSRVDERADIYALGATAYHLFAGQAPFAGRNVTQVFAQKLQSGPPPLAQLRVDLPADTIALVRDLMAIDPDQRLRDYGTVLQRIDDLLAGAGDGLRTMTALETKPAIPAVATAVPVAVPANVTGRARPSRRVWWLIASIATIAVVIAVLLSPWGNFSRATAPATWEPTGWSVPCYNGRSLAGWKTLSGQWTPGQDDGEGGLVLAGAGGAISFPVTKPVGGRPTPLPGFRVVALAHLHEANAVELQCGWRAAPNPSQANRLVLRLEEERVQLGWRNGERGPLEQVVAERTLPIGRDAFHELHLERQPQSWVALVDGQRIGVAPVSSDPILPEFLLSAEKPPGSAAATAWFSDITLEELAPRAAPPSK